MVHSIPLKNVSGQSYKVKIRTFGSSLVCLYAIYEWPEFYVNKDMFCSVTKDFCHLLITFANSKDPDQGLEECYNPK